MLIYFIIRINKSNLAGNGNWKKSKSWERHKIQYLTTTSLKKAG